MFSHPDEKMSAFPMDGAIGLRVRVASSGAVRPGVDSPAAAGAASSLGSPVVPVPFLCGSLNANVPPSKSSEWVLR